MHTAKLTDIRADNSLLTPLRTWRDLQPMWYYATLGYFALMVFCFTAQAFDDRLLYGVSVWNKPFKFSLSLVAYFGTLVIFARYVPSGYFTTWQGRILTAVPFVAALGEMIYITGQAALGEPSHFNTSTPFHAAMYSLMGAGAAAMVAVLVWLGWVIGRARGLSDPLMLAIVSGLVLTCVLGGGFGGYLGSQGAHWVGGAQSDADGMVLVNWARDGGDLRVAHFFGMHAMQLIPLFAILLPNKLARSTRLSLVALFAVAYAVFCGLTFIQAVQGQPFLA